MCCRHNENCWLHHELTDKIKFGLAIKFQDVFGKEISENFCQATLATYPSGQRDFNKAFHLSTSNFQVKRFQALNAERDRDTYDAEQYWMEAIELLEKSDDTDKAYKIALILRHIAQFNTGIVAADWLKKSIVYDPDDRESYYKILQTYQQSGKADDRYKEWLDKSLVKFPQDLDFLRLVIEEALGKNTYKKAAQYAKSMLKIDPINTYAKQTLFRCYLAHARKLLISQKYHLVQNELNQAQALGLGKRCQNQVTILHGFLIYLGDNNNQGLPLVTEAVKKIDDSPVLRKFVLAMEAGLLKLATEPFVKLLDALPKKYQPSSEELTRLIELVNYYFQEDDNKLNPTHKALSPIKAVLKEAIKALAYNEAELLIFCQCLEKVKHFELLLYCAKIARTKWQNPIWLYYQFYAESDGVANNCKASNIEQLIDYLDRHGRDKKNERATVLIGQFVDLYYQSHAPNSFAPMFDESDMNDDPMEVFFDHLPRAILKKIDTKVNELSKKSPDKIMLMLSKLLPKKIDPMQVMQLMVFEPGLISVLLFLKAADELNIDTDVSIEEVLDYFDFDIHSNQPNLPFF